MFSSRSPFLIATEEGVTLAHKRPPSGIRNRHLGSAEAESRKGTYDQSKEVAIMVSSAHRCMFLKCFDEGHSKHLSNCFLLPAHSSIDEAASASLALGAHDTR